MPLLVTIVLFGFACCLPAAPPPGYYATAEGKAGSQLRQALHAIIRAHAVIPYSSSSFDTSDALKVLDEDPQNPANVLLLYAARSQPKDTFALASGWNREHMWPNNYGLDDRHPAYSDLFNLRAEDQDVNSTRGSKIFDVSDTHAVGYRFPAHPEAPLCSTDADSWEPPAAVKGDIARAMFYMDVRYEGNSGEPDLILTDNVALVTSITNYMGRLGALLAWHAADPVSDAERQRNEMIFANYQHNRNPFVDRPEWADLVFRPALRILRVPGAVEISWEASFRSAVLEAAGGLPEEWAVLAGATNRNGRLVLSEPLAAGPRFYRLR